MHRGRWGAGRQLAHAEGRPSPSILLPSHPRRHLFMQAAVEYMQAQHGVDLAQALGACVAKEKKVRGLTAA